MLIALLLVGSLQLLAIPGTILWLSWAIRREINAQISAIHEAIVTDIEAFASHKPSRLGQVLAGLSATAGRSPPPSGGGGASKGLLKWLPLLGMVVPELRGIANLSAAPTDTPGDVVPNLYKEG